MNGHWWTLWVMWGVTLVAGIAVLVAFAGHSLLPLTLVLALGVVASFGVQLAVADRVGFVERVAASACGSFVLVMLFALIVTVRPA